MKNGINKTYTQTSPRQAQFILICFVLEISANGLSFDDSPDSYLLYYISQNYQYKSRPQTSSSVNLNSKAVGPPAKYKQVSSPSRFPVLLGWTKSFESANAVEQPSEGFYIQIPSQISRITSLLDAIYAISSFITFMISSCFSTK